MKMGDRLKVLYGPEIFFIQKYGGASRYFFELLSNFHKDNNIKSVLPLTFSDNNYLKNATFIKPQRLIRPVKTTGKNKIIKLALRPLNNISTKICNFQLNRNRIKLYETLQKQDFDLFHPTYYNTRALEHLNDQQLVITVYDMIYELFPQQYPNDPYPAYKRELIKRANKIIAISNHTKQDLIKLHKVQEDKIEVIHLGCSFENYTTEQRHDNFLPEEYILYVGERKRYKNFIPFIQSIAPLLKQYKNLKIICAGSKPFNKDEKEFFANLNVSKRMHHYSVSDERLFELYKQAIMFVFPSLYEGFGIPILEAFSAGCPVACSNTSSLPEVAGDAAIFFDPYDEKSICNSIDRLISNKDLRHELTIRGYERVKTYSWKKTAEQTKKLYMSLL